MNHGIILETLEKNGVRDTGKLFNILGTNRGVPQGSALGSILYVWRFLRTANGTQKLISFLTDSIP